MGTEPIESKFFCRAGAVIAILTKASRLQSRNIIYILFFSSLFVLFLLPLGINRFSRRGDVIKIQEMTRYRSVAWMNVDSVSFC